MCIEPVSCLSLSISSLKHFLWMNILTYFLSVFFLKIYNKISLIKNLARRSVDLSKITKMPWPLNCTGYKFMFNYRLQLLRPPIGLPRLPTHWSTNFRSNVHVWHHCSEPLRGPLPRAYCRELLFRMVPSSMMHCRVGSRACRQCTVLPTPRSF